MCEKDIESWYGDTLSCTKYYTAMLIFLRFLKIYRMINNFTNIEILVTLCINE